MSAWQHSRSSLTRHASALPLPRPRIFSGAGCMPNRGLLHPLFPDFDDSVLACVPQAVQTATASAQHANAVAKDVARSKSAKEAGTKLWVVWRHIDNSAYFASFARMLVGHSCIANWAKVCWCLRQESHDVFTFAAATG